MRLTSLIKRFAKPREVASLMAYVASPLASATTGAALRLDGGVVKSAFRFVAPTSPIAALQFIPGKTQFIAQRWFGRADC